MRKINKLQINELKDFKDIFDRLLEYVFDDKKILIAVSGGPDSMFLSVLIYNYFIQNQLDLNNLFFIHCNHKTRKETEEEQKFIKEFFDGLNLNITIYSRNEKKTENSLRNWRYGEFQKIIDQNHIDYILTGHNLTDRIESSFMNVFRGSGLNGFLSMKFIDQSPLLQNVKTIRPLLSFTKIQIEDFCSKFKIPFFIDQSNLDSTTSLRNKIRLELFPQFEQLSNSKGSFYQSMFNIYSELENQEEQSFGNLIEIRKSAYWNSNYAFLRDIPLPKISQNIILQVLKKLNLSSNITEKTLNDLYAFFQNSKQGHKYINGTYFFLSHSKIYIIKAKENFWKKHIEKSIIINKLGKLEVGKEIVSVDNSDTIGLKIRYPKSGDKIGNKTWSKYCINKQIPIFWRNFIPVIVSSNNILKYFYSQ
ncbi:MAG: tRNA lysidine(34) synthetase TilS [Candidatus Absconditabacterales bacterium]|nr:tRNA lysidine(34) synthetase TilS [Candidatus Absconditabacterales bacterium]